MNKRGEKSLGDMEISLNTGDHNVKVKPAPRKKLCNAFPYLLHNQYSGLLNKDL